MGNRVELTLDKKNLGAFKVFPSTDYVERIKIDPLPWFKEKSPASIGKNGVLFDKLIPIWSEISGSSPVAALGVVNRRLEESSQEISYFGLTVDEKNAAVVSPILTFAILFYLYINVLHIKRCLPIESDVASTFPWSPLFDGWLSLAFTVGSIIAFPVIANGILLLRINHGGFTIIGIIAIFATLVSGVFVLRVTRGIRNELSQK